MTAGQWTMAGQNWVLTIQILGLLDMFVVIFYSFKEIFIFNYLIIMRDNIHVSERKRK